MVTNAVGLVSHFLAQMIEVSEEILAGISPLGCSNLGTVSALALAEGSSSPSFPECWWSAISVLSVAGCSVLGAGYSTLVVVLYPRLASSYL